MRLVGEDAVLEQLLAGVPAGAQLGADVDARPEPAGPHLVDAVADEFSQAGSQPVAEGLGALLELTGAASRSPRGRSPRPAGCRASRAV